MTDERRFEQVQRWFVGVAEALDRRDYEMARFCCNQGLNYIKDHCLRSPQATEKEK